MKMFKCILTLVMVLSLCSPAMALDTAACGDDFVYNNDWNVTCQGRLELSDMGQFINGVWEWDQAFLAEYNANNYTQRNEEELLPIPVANYNSGPVLLYGRIDNRAWAESRGRDADSRFVFQGEFVESSGYLIPSIWKFEVTPFSDEVTYDMATCPEGPFMTPPYTAYCDYVNTFPGDTDPIGGGLCYDIDSSVDCSPIYPDTMNNLVTINDNGLGYYMDKEYQAPDGNPIMLSEGNEAFTSITFDDVQDVTWVEGSQTRLPYYTENANYYYIGFDMGINQINTNGDFRYDPNNIYFIPFEGQVPVGPQTFVVNMKDGSFVTVNAEISSNTLMPVIAKTTTMTQLVELRKLGKSGKIMATEGEVEVANLKARTIINDDGLECLLIQLNEPDRAMELTNPRSKLRIWVAEPDMLHEWSVGDNRTVDFLWINAPLHTGSIVVPADAWEAIKERPDVQAAGEVVIGGMYREQLPTGTNHFEYHNRGYIDSIVFPIQ